MTHAMDLRLIKTFILSGSVHLGLVVLVMLEPSLRRHIRETVEVTYLRPSGPQVVKRVIEKVKAPVKVEEKIEAESLPRTTASVQSVEMAAVERASVVSVDHEYEAYIKALLQRQRRYPEAAQRLRQQGKVMVRVKVERSGRILAAEIIEKSPYDILNKSARELIENIGHLKPFPETAKELTLVLNVPIEYIL